VTKIPLILTLSDLPSNIENSLINPIRDTEVSFEIVKYKYMQLSPKEIVASLKIISVFEQLIALAIEEEEFESHQEKDVKQ
jgi:hypothetical protein